MPDTLLSVNRSTSSTRTAVLGVILFVYVVGRIIEVLPFSTPSTPIVALEVLSALAFALIHGKQQFGLRGILVFMAICLVVGNILENLSILTGFPFGHYQFLSLMGPKFLQVPVLLGLAYIGMAYLSWTLARLILGATKTTRPKGLLLVSLPLLASCIMTAWDFAQDPVWSTLLHAWRWRDGGAWFGVPYSNFAGWMLTVFLIYFVFALYLRGSRDVPHPSGAKEWRLAVLLYALCAAGNVLQLARPQPVLVIADAAGRLWHTAAILRASALISILVMGSLALLAWIRVPRAE